MSQLSLLEQIGVRIRRLNKVLEKVSNRESNRINNLAIKLFDRDQDGTVTENGMIFLTFF